MISVARTSTLAVAAAIGISGCARAPQAYAVELQPLERPASAATATPAAAAVTAPQAAASTAQRYSLPPGCVPAGKTFACNPITNAGCDRARGETCDDDMKGDFTCYPPPNEVGEGGECNDKEGPSCAAGMACDTVSASDPRGVCRKLCCAAAECRASHRCQAVDPSYGTFGFCK